MGSTGRTLYLESVGGVAGDMFAAAFVDAGLVSQEEILSIPERLGLEDIVVRFESVVRSGLAATRMVVAPPGEDAADDPGLVPSDAGGHGHSHSHVHLGSIQARIESADLAPGVQELAIAIFRCLAEAEASVHGQDIDRVAFHEVGADDAIVDVVAAATCVEAFGAGRVIASPLRLGAGFASMAHGLYPLPPPATASLVRGMPLAPEGPGSEESRELTTPTGAAILRALEPEFHRGWPPGVVGRVGYGAGSRDFGPVPNVFRVVELEDEAPRSEGFLRDEVGEIEFFVDDDTPEHLAWLQEAVFQEGAIDAWMTPAMGKKGRLGTHFAVLTKPGELEKISAFLLRKSTSFGVRVRISQRRVIDRRIEVEDSSGTMARVKIGLDPEGRELKRKTEYEDRKRDW
jgi:uncharacterized protein (TIGR00299 family) protein